MKALFQNTAIASIALVLFTTACNREPADIYSPANGCYQIVDSETDQALIAQDSQYIFGADSGQAMGFTLRPSDLGMYLLYDKNRNYLIPAIGSASKTDQGLEASDSVAKISIGYHESYSLAEWELVSADEGANRYHLYNIKTARFIAKNGLSPEVSDAAVIKLVETDDCAEYPELAVDAQGQVRNEPWPNGDVYGFADIHSHLFTNEGFGGGGMFHGAPFHKLGVEHALTDCTEAHGQDGRRDLIGFFYTGDQAVEVGDVLPILTKGEVPEFNHATTGYPEFAAWPNARDEPTHQQQYYIWLKRAYLSGMRLIVQLATGNSALCELIVGLGAQPAPYGCNDMASVDRTIKATFALERYIDAQAGGPGKGWFRVVGDTDAAREVINQGKLAVVLGIEISNLFDCFLTPPPGAPACDAELVMDQVERYYNKGVRVIFPVHKFDNGFAAGDGASGALEIGNVLNSGHYNNKVSECPDFEHNFDHGPVVFGGLNKPRTKYFSEPDFDMTRLSESTLQTLAPLLDGIASDQLDGDYCQAQGLTDLGKTLIRQLVQKGMIVDIAHMPRRATVDAFELFDQFKYPAISTHNLKYDGRIYKYGGLSKTGFGTCANADHPGTMLEGYLEIAHTMQSANGFPAEPFGFDLNGFAGSKRPRFGPNSPCSQPQPNPLSYPFKSFDGQVTFTQPTLGNRIVDYNTEGMLHLGLLPELIEDVRNNSVQPNDIEPLFRSAESFIRSWEAAEAASGN